MIPHCILLAALWITLAVSGCYVHARTDVSEIGHDFETRDYCPRQRTTIAQLGPERPPPEVASDSERLVLWSRQDKQMLYTARGCGHSRLYKCKCLVDLQDHSCTPQCREAGELMTRAD